MADTGIGDPDPFAGRYPTRESWLLPPIFSVSRAAAALSMQES